MSRIHDDDWGAEGITAEDDFIERFEKAFPEFVLPPSEIVKIFKKNDRYKVNQASITPELDHQLDECMDRMSEVLDV
jgi:hypothetical protein